MTTLDYILHRFNLPKESAPLPVEIPQQSRDVLPVLFAELGFSRGAEIGVWRGDYSRLLCEANPALHLTCVDAWMPYSGYVDHTRQDLMQEAYQEARRQLAPYACTFITAFSTDAAKQVKAGSLDFVYIDANHSFEHVVADLAAWVPKVRSGGIIAGHDYRQFRRSLGIRVVEAVHGYTQAHDITPWFVLGRNKVRVGEIRDRERTYFWVNP